LRRQPCFSENFERSTASTFVWQRCNSFFQLFKRRYIIEKIRKDKRTRMRMPWS
jgi:hypothetical protein